MARLYPNQPIGIVTPENARVFHALRRIPGDQTHAWMSLQHDDHWRPDWMILHEQRVCYLIVVSTLSLQGDLFGDTPRDVVPGMVETENLKRFFNNLSAEGDIPPVYGVVLFPNISQDFLDEMQEHTPNPDVALWGRDMISGPVLLEALQMAESDSTKVFPTTWLDLLRQKICPETRIPRDLTVTPKRRLRRDLGPRHTRQLLDLDQEYWVKADLQTSDEAEEAIITQKLRLLTGVAGSGKSLVLLYRAALQTKLNPSARMLTLTHNRPLSFELRLRQEKIQPGTQVKWETFYQWCDSLLHNQLPVLYSDKVLWLNVLRTKYTNLSNLPDDFISDEIDWIREQAFDEEEVYLTTSRRGRKRPLQHEQRTSMLELLADYRQKMRDNQKTDWTAIAENVWLALKSGEITTPIYDHILVDEAQFFPPLWFKMILRCQEPQLGTLFLAADPTQGFLRQRTSWRDCGVQVRGLSAHLRKAYRNCREILAFAAAFYRRRLPELDEDNNLPEESDLEGLPTGSLPKFIQVEHQQDESTCVANEILEVLKLGQSASSMMVLFKTDYIAKSFVEKLNRLHGSRIAWDARQPHQPHQSMVRVATLNSATGLESQAVFLCGIDCLFDEEERLGLESGEKEEIVRNHTRQIYMALTRASRQLYIIHRHPRTREILEGPPITQSSELQARHLENAAS